MSLTTGTNFIKEIRKRPQDFYIVHYSCQNLNDDNEGLSPRITSIAVTHYATAQTVSFSTHAIAEELRIPRELVHEEFDKIECEANTPQLSWGVLALIVFSTGVIQYVLSF